MAFELNPVEARILGCLLEKERITLENYPLSLNALTAACNQTTARDPVVTWDEKTVEAGVNSLREKKLATVVFGAGARVQKYRHNLIDHFELDRREVPMPCPSPRLDAGSVRRRRVNCADALSGFVRLAVLRKSKPALRN